VRAALEQAISLKGEQVVVDGARGRESDRIRDLPNGRRIAAVLDGLGDAVEDSLPSLCVVPGQ
jgi:hypothetical protein